MEHLIPIVLAVFFSALFSGLEMAYLSVNKLHVELERKKGNWNYQLIGFLADRPAAFIAAILVGNNVALVLYGNYMHRVLGPMFSWTTSEYLILLLETLASTIVILVMAEFLPKTWFRHNAEGALKWLSLPAFLFFWIFRIPSAMMLGLSRFFLRVFLKRPLEEEEVGFGRVELGHYIRERVPTAVDQDDTVDPELEMFKNALEFPETKAREFMVPRTEIDALEVNDTVQRCVELFISTGYSKILVYEGNIDTIIGYVHSFELFKKPSDLRSVLRPVSFIPESMRADELLNLFTKDKRSICVVLDEHGGTSGIVTLEDVIEEIFGEIEDEHDQEDLLERKVSENEWLFSARLDLGDINERWGLDLPENENYNTLSGLLLDLHQNIPDKGDIIRWKNYLFVVKKVSANRVEEVLVRSN